MYLVFIPGLCVSRTRAIIGTSILGRGCPLTISGTCAVASGLAREMFICAIYQARGNRTAVVAYFSKVIA